MNLLLLVIMYTEKKRENVTLYNRVIFFCDNTQYHFFRFRLSDSLDLEEEDFEMIQRFVVTLYDRTNPCTDVNECRRMLFTKKQRPVESLPPTQDALRLHVHRTMNESSKFCNATERTMPLRNVLEWGYKKNERGMTVPRWMNQPEASKACQELIKCGCKKMCGARCKCKKAGLSCTELCQCGGC
eukprot:TCONS_00067280-protein